jgi:hypothetical protein
MNEVDAPAALKGPLPGPALPPPDRDTSPGALNGHRNSSRLVLGLGVLVLFITALGLGVWRHYQHYRQVVDTAEQQADFVPTVRVQEVAQRLGNVHMTLPATTLGFEEANIYGRASGYVLKRYVDIGDHVKPARSSPRSPLPRSRTRSRNIRAVCSRRTKPRARIRPNNRWPGLPGDATRYSSSKAG